MGLRVQKCIKSNIIVTISQLQDYIVYDPLHREENKSLHDLLQCNSTENMYKHYINLTKVVMMFYLCVYELTFYR